MANITWDGYKVLEDRFLEEHSRRLEQLRTAELEARAKKVAIMNQAGLACSWDDPDYYMFHNPFVWMNSDYHRPWRGIDYGIARGVLDIETRVRDAWNEFWRWSYENDPWYLIKGGM